MATQSKKTKRRKSETKQRKKSNKEALMAKIPGVFYKGSGEMSPAMKELLKKLKRDGPGSLDSSGMGNRWKI